MKAHKDTYAETLRDSFDEALNVNYNDEPDGRTMTYKGHIMLNTDDAAWIIERLAQLTAERDLLRAKLDATIQHRFRGKDDLIDQIAALRYERDSHE